MAEAEAFRSIALPFALFAVLGCAVDANVISDAPQSRAQGVDAGTPGGDRPPFDASVTYDTGAWDSSDDAPAADAMPDAPWLEIVDAGPPQWSVCNPSLDFGHVGDSCSFVGGCYQSLPNCRRRTALCADLTLYLGEISKTECVADDPDNTRRCAEPILGTCCIKMWQCEAGSEPAESPSSFATVCAVGCDTTTFPRSEKPVTGCPDDPTTPLWPRWPPEPRTPCKGSFVCDSLGQSAGPDTEVFELDAYGRLYWCQNGMVQQAAAGANLPWNP